MATLRSLTLSLIACSTSIIVYNKKSIKYSLCQYSNDKTKLKTLEATENDKVKATNAVPAVQTAVDNDVYSGEYSSLYWEKKKLGCPFCKSFLDSQCESPFKAWYICVEEVKAKTPPPSADPSLADTSQDASSFEIVCSPYTASLVDCISLHPSEFGDIAAALGGGGADADSS